MKQKTIELGFLDELHEEFHSLRYEDEKFSEFVERTTDDGKPIWKEIKKLKCRACKNIDLQLEHDKCPYCNDKGYMEAEQ